MLDCFGRDYLVCLICLLVVFVCLICWFCVCEFSLFRFAILRVCGMLFGLARLGFVVWILCSLICWVLVCVDWFGLVSSCSGFEFGVFRFLSLLLWVDFVLCGLVLGVL